MSALTPFNPFRALGDLRRFLGSRGRHEIVFLFAALMLCGAIVGGFMLASNVEKPYKPPVIIYAESWPATRTDAEIIAQQKIDLEKKKIQGAKEARFEAEKRAAFKRAGDQLRSIGL